jgi:programmed cell death 6-interacting protein
MSSNLLFIPYRKTERIPFGKKLRDIISREYYQTATVFEKDLQEVDTLRNDIIDLDVTTQDLALLKRYYIHLSTLVSKFPKDVVEFPWFGTLGYNVTGPVKLKSILFEKINILYNISALYSQLGANQDRSTDDGLKKSCLYFQYASTYLNYILTVSEDPDLNVQLPLDLQKGTIETLRLLMIGQAQEVFWQKALIDTVKDSLVARLAIQVADYYDKALESVNRSEGFRSEWVHHITVKKLHFEAAAQFRASLVAVSESKYGLEVSRLRKSLQSIKQAYEHLKFTSPALRNDLEGLASIVKETLIRAEKDNDLIYLHDVPADPPIIVKAPITKEMEIDDIKNPSKAIAKGDYGRLLFKDLLPFYVIQSAEAYRERQEAYIHQHIQTPIQALSRMLESFIQERGLPASLDAVEKPLLLPSGLLEHHQEIKSQGGVHKIEKTLLDIQKLSLEGEHLIQGAKERLKLEAQEDELMRQRQGSNYWTRPTSDVASSSLTERVKDLENYLRIAKEGDETIKTRFSTVSKLLEILGSSESKILEYIPSSRTKDLDPSLRRVVLQLKETLTEKKKLEINRDTFLETVEIKSAQYNILPKIISEYKSIMANFKDLEINTDTFAPVFERHIKNFDKDIEFIEKEKDKQRKLEDKIDKLNTQFSHLNNSQGVNTEREKALKQLDGAYSQYKDLVNNITQGLKFYNDFNNNCHRLIEEIDNFVYERRVEARDLEA